MSQLNDKLLLVNAIKLHTLVDFFTKNFNRISFPD